MILSAFYSFCRTIEGGCTTYNFQTDFKISYSVYFCSNNYDNYLYHYPNLLKNNFDFGFFPVPNPPVEKHSDNKVFFTILKIVNDFVGLVGKDCVLIFHCFEEDEKQKLRGRLFSIWSNNSEYLKLFRTKIVEITEEDKSSHFIGFSALIENQNISYIEAEFDHFSDSFILNNK